MLPLRTPILFERGRPPYILARAKWDVTGLSYWIGFVVDTGAFDITLSMTDVDNLGADKDRLDESRSPVFGIGGGVRTYDMKGVTVSFTGDDLKEVAFDMPTVRVLHVDDNCRAIDLVLSKGKPGDIINIGSGNEVPNIDVARLILRHMGKPENLITFVKDRPGHDFRYSLNWDRLRKMGWKPKVKFEDGLNATVDWYLKNREWWAPLI